MFKLYNMNIVKTTRLKKEQKFTTLRTTKL